MSAIKDILDKIDKLSPADQERLKTILLSKTFTKSISIEEFVTKERFANGPFALFVVLLTLFATAKEKTALKSISVKIVANRLLLQPILSCLEHVKTLTYGLSTLIAC